MGWLENTIADLLPGWGAARAKARYKRAGYEHARALYEGAAVTERTRNWRRSMTDANAELSGGALGRLRANSHDLYRNNPLAKRGIDAIASNVVGATGIVPQFKGGSDRELEELKAVAKDHLMTEAIDASGDADLTGLQELVMGGVATSGEILVRRRPRRSGDGLPLPFQVQLLEPDYLDDSKDRRLDNGGAIIQGVEFNAIGRRTYYWFHREHPGSRQGGRSSESVRVPARDVLHIYRKDRPGQVRGVPWLAPVMVRMRELADYQDAQLVRQKIAAAMSAFITNVDGDIPNAPGAVDTADGSEMMLGPGTIGVLPAGRDIKFTDPPAVDGYGEFTAGHVQQIAIGLGVPDWVISGNLAGFNYSSGRMGWIEFNRYVAGWQHRIMIRQFCHGIERWTLEAAMLARGIMGQHRAVWMPPGRAMVDPTGDITAMVAQVRSGLLSLPEAIAMMGKDPDEHLEELARVAAKLDKLGLVLDTDARRVSRQGVTNARPDGTDWPDSDDIDEAA